MDIFNQSYPRFGVFEPRFYHDGFVTLPLQVGITERSVQRILSDLEESGVVTRIREGRRNRYEVDGGFQLRHPLEAKHTLKELLGAIS